MQITDTTNIFNIMEYIEQTPSAREALTNYTAIIESYDDEGHLNLYPLVEALSEYKPINVPVLYFVFAVMRAGYPKNGHYHMTWYRFSGYLRDIGLDSEAYSATAFPYSDFTKLTTAQLSLLPTRCRTREIRRRGSEQRKLELKKIQLNQFSFKIFQNAINNTNKLITIKDGLEYLEKLKVAYNEHRTSSTLTAEAIEIYYQWAGYIYSKIRNPNDDVKRTIKDIQTDTDHAIYWHYLPTVYLTQKISPEVMSSLINHKQVVLYAKVLDTIWDKYFSGNLRNVLTMSGLYFGYGEVFPSHPELYQYKTDTVMRRKSCHRLLATLQIFEYIAFKDETLRNSIWFKNIILQLHAITAQQECNEESQDQIKRYKDEALSQEDFIKYLLQHQEQTLPAEQLELQPVY